MSAPAGWHPQSDGRLRYWDGELWTEHFAPSPPPGTTAAVGRTRPKFARVAWIASLAFVLLLIVVMGVGGAISPKGVTTETFGAASGIRSAPRPAGPTSADAVQTPVPTVIPSAAVAPVVPAPAAPSPASTPSTHPAAGTALAAIAGLVVKGRAAKNGYTRDQFGQSWFDTDRNGCDTRNDILRRDLASRQMKNGCKVLAGSLTPDPYTATSIRFVYGGASEVDIDHVVALSDAWQKGAARWPEGKRLAFANDPLNLLAVDASANRSKGDGDTATWLPPNKSYRCAYVARQVAVKGKYGVWVTEAERNAMTRVLTTCPSMRLPGPGSAPVIAALPRTATHPSAQSARAARPQPPAQDVYYENCTAARAAGAAPIMRGEPGYASKFDRDHDGIACE